MMSIPGDFSLVHVEVSVTTMLHTQLPKLYHL